MYKEVNVDKSFEVFLDYFHVQSLILHNHFFRFKDIDFCAFPHSVVSDIKCWEFEMEHL